MTGPRLSDPTGKKLVLNAANTFFSYLFPVLTVMYISRVLKPEGLGTVTLAASVVSYFSMLATAGIPNYAFRACAQNRKDAGKLSRVTRELMLLGLCSALLAYAALAATVFLVPAFREQQTLYLLLGLGVFFTVLRGDWFLSGMEQWTYRTVSSFILYAAALVLTVTLVRTAEDRLLYAALTLTVPLMSTLCNQLFIRRGLSRRAAVAAPLRPFTHLRSSLRFLLMSCVVNIYSQMDIVMLGFMADGATVGYYGIASKIKTVLCAPVGIIWNVNLPQAVKCLSEKDFSELQRITSRSMRLALLLQIPIFVFSLLFAGGMVNFISGAEYAPAVLPLRILLLALPPIAVSGILGGQLLIPAGMEKQLLKAETAGVAVNLILNALLIPLFSMNGAAAATVAAEVAVCVVAVCYVKRNLPVRIFDARFILKTVLLTCLSTGVTLPFSALLGSFLPADSIFTLILCAVCFASIYFGAWFICRKLNLSKKLPYLLDLLKTPKNARTMYCPCCGKHFREFIDGGFTRNPLRYNPGRYRAVAQDVICPYCASAPRHRIIACWAEQNAELLRRSDILYFAPEASMLGWLRKHRIGVTTADLYAKADLRLDVTCLDLPDRCYDVVFCNHVLEHVGDYSQALGELHRILRPGGKLVISFPVDLSLPTVLEAPAPTAADRLALFGQQDHLRIFGADSAEILAAVGFSVTTVDTSLIPDSVRPAVGPADYDSNLIFVCTKN